MAFAPAVRPLPVVRATHTFIAGRIPPNAGAWLGLAALLAWTGAWTVAGSLQQGAYRPQRDHISGLAALNAQYPQVMIAGFVLTGVLILALTVRVWRRLPGNHWAIVGVSLLVVVGIGFVAAGLLRNDCADTVRACAVREAQGHNSWHSQMHNLIASSLFLYALVPALFALALRGQGQTRGLRGYSIATAVLTLAALAAFQLRWWVPWEGVLQRTAISLPLVWTAIMCGRLGQLKQALKAVAFVQESATADSPDHPSRTNILYYAAFSLTQRWTALVDRSGVWAWHSTRCGGARSPPARFVLATPLASRSAPA